VVTVVTFAVTIWRLGHRDELQRAHVRTRRAVAAALAPPLPVAVAEQEADGTGPRHDSLDPGPARSTRVRPSSSSDTRASRAVS
jgi:hypothetical protein